MMTSESGQASQAALERLSALMDGEADAVALDASCGAWPRDAVCRAAWHTYHLIGDVLRSDDLAVDAGRDAGFLAALRARLAAEPTLLAPAPLPRARTAPRWGGFGMAAAIAAGFFVVGGVVLVLQSQPSGSRALLAQSAAPQPPLQPVTARSTEPAEAPATLASGQMIRDARLQQYLIAHKQFSGGTALAVPSGFLRNATVEVPAR
jgi:sigma-E factor negative regulatory protein RseA